MKDVFISHPVGGRNIAISVSVCLSVCSRISKTTCSRFTKLLPVAVAQSYSDNNAISNVLPVSWMTSCFHIGGSGHRSAARHPLPERRRLAHSWQQTISLDGTASLLGGREVGCLRLPRYHCNSQRNRLMHNILYEEV